ncbi:MAG: hypothetical protein IVW52_16385 [Acidimicrobiales bacterium]|nr:hypothetical protein [Acidimicrobiales bacterium]
MGGVSVCAGLADADPLGDSTDVAVEERERHRAASIIELECLVKPVDE